MTRSRKDILKNGNGLMMDKKRGPGEDNLQTSPWTTESAKPLQSGSKDIIFKQEQPWDTQPPPKSSWHAVGEPDAPTWKLSGTQGTSAFWEIIGSTIASNKNACAMIFTQSSMVLFPIV